MMWHSRLWGAILNRLRRKEVEVAVLEPQMKGPTRMLTAGDLLMLVDNTAGLLRPQLLQQSGPAAAPPLVGLFLTNSALYVAAVLATLRCGAAFLPLDPRWPPHRLQQVLAEAQPAAVLWAAEDLAGGQGPPSAPGMVALVQLTAQRCQSSPAPEPSPPSLGAAGAADPDGRSLPFCYVLFTSGSTGVPLGVCGTEEGVLNRCEWMQQAYPFEPDDRVAFKTSPCFVDSIWEVFGPLLAGVPLVALPQLALAQPRQLLQLCSGHSVTHLAAVPMLWKGIVAALEATPSLASGLALRLAVSSGEPLELPLLEHMQSLLPWGATILNLYGSTEVAADCTAFDCTAWRGSGQETPPAAAGPGAVPVGMPIAGMWVGIASCKEGSAGAMPVPVGGELLRFLPAGFLGEVVVGGVGLAAGYLNQADATAQRFVEVPGGALPPNVQQGGRSAVGGVLSRAGGLAAEEAGQQVVAAEGVGGRDLRSLRLFCTGDLGMLDGQGRLWLHGRRDLQVKVSGVRFDLAEVEAALRQHPVVRAAAARLWDLPAGPALAGYVELLSAVTAPALGFPGAPSQPSPAAPAPQPIEAQLLKWCQHRLPAASMPTAVVILPQVPRSAAGKVQRAELPLPVGWQPTDGVAFVQLGMQQGGLDVGQAASVAATEAQVDAEGRAAKRRRQLSPSPPAPAGQQPAAHAPAAPPGAPPAAPPGAPPAAPPAPAAAAAAVTPISRAPFSEAQVSLAFAVALQSFLPAGAVPALEPTTNIFSLGTNSLAVAAIAEALGCAAEQIYECPTVRSLAASLRAAVKTEQQLQLQHAVQQLGMGGADVPPGQGPQAVLGLARELALEPATPAGRGRSRDEAAGAGASAGNGEAGLRPLMQLAWRSHMLQCVDAAPLAAVLGGSELVFACSHGGDVCCFDAASGARRWSVVLPDRADVGMVLCSMTDGQEQEGQGTGHGWAGAGDTCARMPPSRQPFGGQDCLAVGTNSGTVFFLDASSGGMLGGGDTGGNLRAAPLEDPWHGMLWMASHAKQLLVLAAPGVVLARRACPAAVSAQVSFHGQLGLAFVACLDGTLVALNVTYPASHGRDDGSRSSPHLELAWQYSCSAPLFVPSLVVAGALEGKAAQRQPLVLAAGVDGSICALEADSGRLIWEREVGAAVFTPLVQVSMQHALSGGSSASAARRPGPQDQQQPWGLGAEAALVLVGTQAGDLCAVDAHTGQMVSRVALGAKITGICALPTLSPLEGPDRQLVLVSTQPGAVCLMDVAALAGASLAGSSAGSKAQDGAELQRCGGEGGSRSEGRSGKLGLATCVVDVVRLPGEVFSVPAAFQGGAVVGCRDDHLYCLSISNS